MPLSFPPGALTLGLLATGSAVLLAAPLPACAVTVQQTGLNLSLKQVRLTVRAKPGCPAPRQAVVRFRTARGGVIPYNGYTLRGARTQTSFWLSRGEPGHSGPAVEQRFASGWKTVWRLGE